MECSRLSKSSLVVSALGLGCMGMSDFYAGRDDKEAIFTLHRAIDPGVTLFDTADVYGSGRSEQLVGKAIRGRRSQVIVATEFGNVRITETAPQGVASGQRYGNTPMPRTNH